jgi:hypothetical protein
VAKALVNRGVTKGMLGDTEGEIADYTATVELDGALPGQVAMALVNRGATKGMLGDTEGEIADGLSAAAIVDAGEEACGKGLGLAVSAACSGLEKSDVDRVLRHTGETLNRLEPAVRSRAIETLLLRLATPSLSPDWPRIFHGLCEDLPPEAAERLEFFRPVAEVLETGDVSRLDPLPPEQRDFVQEVLRKFEGGQEEPGAAES